ncbi:hypothetical protein [Shewanella maritima]|uniref:hypothetical protein n=1 Tax=Shewanella maritima TaxID=2520507 RepID=UPI001F5E5CDA|nr:hypothetical protein [Shewanella maritima]
MWWRVIIVTLAYLLIGAHFLRYGEVEIAALSAAMPLFIAFRHRLSNLIMQLGLIASSVLVWGYQPLSSLICAWRWTPHGSASHLLWQLLLSLRYLPLTAAQAFKSAAANCTYIDKSG